MIGGRGRQQPGVQRQLAAVGGNRQGVILAGIDFLLSQPFVAADQLLLEGGLLIGHRAGDHVRLAAFELRAGQVEHLRRLHVGEGPEHLPELGQVDEFGEAAAGT